MKINQKGFSAVEGLLILVIVGILAGVGWYVWDSNKKTDDALNKTGNSNVVPTAKKADLTDGKLVKTYTDDIGNFSVKYPSAWTLKAGDSNEEQQYSDAKLTSPNGTVLNLYANMGGKGGNCEPASKDTPFKKGNTCPTAEYLSSEDIDINNVYYVSGYDSNDKSIFKRSPIKLVTKHYADTDGKSEYVIGLTDSTPNSPVKLNKPEMGFITSLEFFTVYDSKGTFHPYVYAYASGNNQAFLSSADAATVKAILRTLKMNI